MHQSTWVSYNRTFPSSPSSYTIWSDLFVSNKVSVYRSIKSIGCLYFTVTLSGERYDVRCIWKIVLSELRGSYGYLTLYVFYLSYILLRIFNKYALLSVKKSSVETFTRIRTSCELESNIIFEWPVCFSKCMYPFFLRVTKVYINGSCWGIFIVSHINEVPVAVEIVVWRQLFRNNLFYCTWGFCELHCCISMNQGEAQFSIHSLSYLINYSSDLIAVSESCLRISKLFRYLKAPWEPCPSSNSSHSLEVVFWDFFFVQIG